MYFSCGIMKNICSTPTFAIELCNGILVQDIYVRIELLAYIEAVPNGTLCGKRHIVVSIFYAINNASLPSLDKGGQGGVRSSARLTSVSPLFYKRGVDRAVARDGVCFSRITVSNAVVSV